MKNLFKTGFTLTEVLITITIIGVVATLTITTLVRDIRNKNWTIAADVFEKKFTESLKVMNSQGVLSGYSTTKAFVDEFQKYFKITKICETTPTECFEEKILIGDENSKKIIDMRDIKTSKNFAIDDWGTDIVGIQFANGTTGLLAYNPNCVSNPYNADVKVMNCVALMYDVSGFENPNTLNQDLRITSNVDTSSFGCITKIGSLCITKMPFTPTPVTSKECLQMKNDGIFPYNCNTDTDYFAGAIKQCGGLEHLPTLDQLAEITNKLYLNANISGNGALYNATYLKNASDYGLPEPPFQLLSRDLYRGWGIQYREYNSSTSTVQGGNGSKSFSDIGTAQMICVE